MTKAIYSVVELNKLSKKELIRIIMGSSQTSNPTSTSFPIELKEKQLKKRKIFPFESWAQRKIALKISYFGWNYEGFAAQDCSENTIEHYLFRALKKAELIQDRQSADYNRCGRTDKGVSATSQVVSLKVKSMLPYHHPEAIIDHCPNTTFEAHPQFGKHPEIFINEVHELPYLQMLNRFLPDGIRILGWAPVPKDFSARFDCLWRQYKYFFTSSKMNLDKMQEACQYLLGEHDYRNFCKIDPAKGVQSFERNILEAFIEPISSDMSCFNIKATAFLWHQVRCIMALLLEIGKENEKPQLIKELLDIEKNPRKPNYKMASEIPLVLWDCAYPQDLKFFSSEYNYQNVYKDFYQFWEEKAIQSCMMRTWLDQKLPETIIRDQKGPERVGRDVTMKQNRHTPILERPLNGDEKSVEERMNHFQQKRDKKRQLKEEQNEKDIIAK